MLIVASASGFKQDIDGDLADGRYLIGFARTVSDHLQGILDFGCIVENAARPSAVLVFVFTVHSNHKNSCPEKNLDLDKLHIAQ